MDLNKNEIKITEDGSKTLFSSVFNETYHSTHGAVQESTYVFIDNGIDRLRDRTELHVFEVGFGSGLNTLLSILYAHEHRKSIVYHSIEAFPISMEEATELEFQKIVSQNEFRELPKRIHIQKWNKEIVITEFFTLMKIFERIQDFPINVEYYDCILFDAFSPSTQGEMWTIDILGRMYNALNSGGLFVTYCAQGQVKRDLKKVGFEVQNVPGPPGKREMTLAWKR